MNNGLQGRIAIGLDNCLDPLSVTFVRFLQRDVEHALIAAGVQWSRSHPTALTKTLAAFVLDVSDRGAALNALALFFEERQLYGKAELAWYDTAELSWRTTYPKVQAKQFGRFFDPAVLAETKRMLAGAVDRSLEAILGDLATGQDGAGPGDLDAEDLL